MPSYIVMVDDNFHYMNEEERWQLGAFATADQAIAASKELVDENLSDYYRPGMTATELYEMYVGYGDDPFVISPSDAPNVDFSAWDYAKARAKELCEGSVRKPPRGTGGRA
jgi:hypothetical protein